MERLNCTHLVVCGTVCVENSRPQNGLRQWWVGVPWASEKQDISFLCNPNKLTHWGWLTLQLCQKIS